VRHLLFILLLAGAALAQDLAALSQAYGKSPTEANRNALLSYAARHKDTGGLALLAVGAHDVAAGRHRAALPHLRAALPRVPKLSDITAHLIATASFETKDHAAAVAAVEPALSAALRSPVRGSAAVTAARAHLALNVPDRAVAVLRAAYDDVPNPAADVLLGAAYEVAGDVNNAVTHYQRAWLDYPASADSKQAEGALARLRQQLGNAYPQPAPAALLERAVKLMNARDYAKARAEFAELSARGGAVGDTAAVRVGVAEHRSRNYSFAIGYLRGLQVSTAEADAERLYQVVVAARRLNQLDALDAAVSELGRKHPGSEWRAQALAAAGDEYWFLNRMNEAEPFYRVCFEQFPKSSQAAHCSWRTGFMAYLDDRSDAVDVLLNHVLRYPGSEKASGALYFLGRGAERQSRWAEARAYYDQIQRSYPNYYYAVLARERMKTRELGRAVPSPAVLNRFAGTAFPAGTDGARFQPSAEARLRFERANLLRTAGLDTFAVSELRFGAVTGKQPEVYGLELAREASARSAPEQGIRYLKRYAPGYLHAPLPRLPGEFWRLSFPLPFRESLERHARGSGLDPFVVAGLVRQESEFDARAVSRARAYGLTQVLPSTGRDVSRRLGISGFQPTRLFDPDFNLRLGTHYLKMLLDQFGGRWEPALASYNAGKSRADAWLKRREYREPAEFVESIPFTETRNYVQSVLRIVVVGGEFRHDG
jgi:soluble lytic murein transglycosylase